MLPEKVLVVCQVFGAFPFRYRKTSSGQKVIEYSPTVFLWGVILTVIEIVTSMIAICVDYSNKDDGAIRMTSPTSVLVVCFDIGTLNLLAAVSVVFSARKHQVFIKICNILGRVDNLMRTTKSKQRGELKAIMLFSFMIFVLIVSARVDTVRWEGQHRKYAGIYEPTFITYCVYTVLLLHYGYMARNVTFRFKTLNEEMKRVLSKNAFGPRKRGNSISNVEIPQISENDSDISEIKTLMDVYWLLCEAVRQTNAFYSSQLLVAVLTTFIHLLNTFYYVITNTLPKVQPESVPYIVMLSVWTLVHSTQLVLLVWPSTDITEARFIAGVLALYWVVLSWPSNFTMESYRHPLHHLLERALLTAVDDLLLNAEETSQVICKFINKNLNSDVENLLDGFLLQLRHNTARLSALGLFPIHRHILTSIAGSVTTYLVILVQFHITQEKITHL